MREWSARASISAEIAASLVNLFVGSHKSAGRYAASSLVDPLACLRAQPDQPTGQLNPTATATATPT